MRLFTRRQATSPRDADLPLSVAQAQRLRETVRWAFLEAGREVSVHPDHVADEQGQRYSLGSIAAVCADSPIGEWAGLARIHVRAILSTGPEISTMRDDELAALVRLRLVAREELVNPSWHPISPGPTRDLVELVTIDLPDTVVTPPEAEFGVREGGLSRWREIARNRLVQHLAEVDLDHQRLGMDEADAFHVVRSESVYTASFALLLSELMAKLGIPASESGVLLAVPFRSQIALRVVDGPDATLALHQLFRFAMSGYDEAPGGISPHVFWVYDNHWIQVTTIEDGKARVSVDEELAQVLGLGDE